MTAKEFVLIPRELYMSKQPQVEQILQQPSIKEKAMQISLLQRNNLKPLDNEETEEIIPPEKKLREKVFAELGMLPKTHSDRAKIIFDKIIASDNIQIDDNGYLVINNISTTLPVTKFLYTLQQPRSKLDVIYRDILTELNLSAHLLINTNAKNIVEKQSSETSTEENNTDFFSENEQGSTKQWETFKKRTSDTSEALHKGSSGVRKHKKSARRK